MRILFTHRELDHSVLCLAKGLSSRDGFDIFITTEDNSRGIYTEGGIIFLPIPPISGKIVWGVVRAIRRYNKEYGFDLIYSVGSSGLSNALISTIGSRTINVGYRGTGAKIRRFDPTYYLGVLNPRVAHMVCETIHVEEYLRAFIPAQRLSVATKPFDIAWATEASAHPIEVVPATSGRLRFITVGMFKGRPYKGLRTLVKAFNQLKGLPASLIVVGDYDDSDYQLSQEGGNAEAFHFLGAKSEAMRYMVGADVYILPSLRDASPRVIREAMALGLPTIVSDIPGSRDLIVKDQTGLLATAGDVADFVRAISWMVTHREQISLMGDRGREHLISHFGLGKYIDYFEELFRRLSREAKA